MRPFDWGPPVLWMGLILWLSSDAWNAARTGALLLPLLNWLLPGATAAQLATVHWGIRKLAHAGEYAVLARLWWRAFTRGPGLQPRTAAGLALALAVGWAGADEGRQALTVSRTPHVLDVAIDSTGAALAAAGSGLRPARRGRRRRRSG
jgi:VanZ family protein